MAMTFCKLNNRNNSVIFIFLEMENPEIAGNNGLVGCLYGYSVTAASFCFFLLLQGLVKRYAIPDWVDARERWRWKNILLSWIHAFIIGVWVLSWLVLSCSVYSLPFGKNIDSRDRKASDPK